MFDPADLFSHEAYPLDRRTLPRTSCQVEAEVTFHGDKSPSPCVVEDLTEVGIKIWLSARDSYPPQAHIRVPRWDTSYDAVVTWAFRRNVGLYLVERFETRSFAAEPR
jgi:hypothetical protein